jgi:hypothetical protein
MEPVDCLMGASVFLPVALTLAARAWVKSYEPQTMAARRAASTLEAYAAAQASARNGEARSDALRQ